MGFMRKDPTSKGYGRGKGQTVKGKIKTRDTGKGFGRAPKASKPIKPMGRGV